MSSFEVDCRGRYEGVKFKKGAYVSDRFECSDPRAKARAIKQIWDQGQFAANPVGKVRPCKGRCRKPSVCLPTTLNRYHDEEKADLTIMTGALFGKTVCQYVLEVKRDCEFDLITRCACIPPKRKKK